ncbi:hypothetical protein KQI88_00485 [Alkaliphilus sp. MSJ-5]|uniref:Uncharacterized protein n=1 Tax=Alkaliphilus flagellatus TaxID=2841507 RepID=A0ABS6FYB1_9FIRM|nr:hypothetical protein [Alkaliphilus flagellatus]MBU5674891.1 hypothetical protein [Alkaliphilus flagellatus]
MDSQKNNLKEAIVFLFQEILVAVKQGIIGVLVGTGIGIIISLTKHTEIISSINRWLYITGVALMVLAIFPSSNLDYAYYSYEQSKAAANRRSERYDSILKNFIRAATVLILAVILEKIRRNLL